MRSCPLLLATIACVWLPVRSTADTVRVAICQVQAVDGDLAGDLARAEDFVERAAASGARIAVFPELVDVGFGKIVKETRGGENARPVPGETSTRFGALARKHDLWIAAALLEAVPGGAYDTSVLIDNRGTVALKQRKLVAYPVFGGAAAFQGNYQDMQTVPSPWGPIGLMNCRDADGSNARALREKSTDAS